MNALLPRARTLLDQSVQSLTLSQKHRAQLWTQLQHRVNHQSPNGSLCQPNPSTVVRLTLWQCLFWLGTVATMATATTVYCVTADRAGSAALGVLCEQYPHLASNSCDARGVARLALAESPRLGAQATVRLPAKPSTPANRSNAQRVTRIPARETSDGRRAFPQSPLALERLAKLTPQPGKPRAAFGVDQSGEVPIGVGLGPRSAATFRHRAMPVGSAPGPLEFALNPLEEGWLGAPMPFKLTEPQFQLELTAFE